MIATVDESRHEADLDALPDPARPTRSTRLSRAARVIRRLGRLRTVLLAVLVAGVVAAVPLGLVARSQAAADSRGAAVLAAAARTVSDLVTVDGTTVQQAYDRLRAGATGPWADQLNGQSDSFVRAVQGAQVTSRGNITAAAIQKVDDDTATVLVSASASVRNQQTPTGEPRQYRVALDLVHQGDAWLVTKLDFVP